MFMTQVYPFLNLRCCVPFWKRFAGYGSDVASAPAEFGRIETQVPARLDRLPWSRFHWLIVIGLGTVWILDGLEVTIVGSIASRLTEDGAGLKLTASQIGQAAAFYVGGACLGALFFGQLTDRFGRKKLFLITLLLYIAATVATAFASSVAYFFAMRFLTGAGIGGEYAAINSAIDELIPARVRGRVDLIINGSYWVGAAIGAVGAIFLLDTNIFAADLGWRLAFAMGAILGLAILLVRRSVPESPRWLFIHGREEEAEAIVERIERDVTEETGQPLPEPRGTIEVQQRKKTPFREIARTAFKTYPHRTILGLALFVGQAFIYNAITFDLGTLFSEFFGVASGSVPFFFAVFAVANFLGPLTLGRLFDTVGRKPMITSTYFGCRGGRRGAGGAAVERLAYQVVVPGDPVRDVLPRLSRRERRLPDRQRDLPDGNARARDRVLLCDRHGGGRHHRAALFGHLINTGDAGNVAIGFYIGAGVMAIGGIAELLFGVRAEQRSLEGIAEPLAAENVTLDEDVQPDRAERPREVPQRPPTPSRRFRLGPGSSSSSPGMWPSGWVDSSPYDEEAGILQRALEEQGAMERRELARRVGARYWGPGRFSGALEQGVRDGSIQRLSRSRFGPAGESRPRGEQAATAGRS